MKLLITGFEPFGGFKKNPSEIIALELNGKTIANLEIYGKSIPLRYKEIKSTIAGLIEEINPQIILNLGQAPRSTISFERIAINIADASKVAYNCGSKPDDEFLEKNGPTAYFSSLPIKELVIHLQKNGIPSYISNSAGTFGCNQIMYHTLNYIKHKRTQNDVLAGFIHLPMLPEQTIKSPLSPSMDIGLMKRAITLVVDFLGEMKSLNETKN